MRGVTRQVGNEIDEFVTEAVRNNLLGLPLDLAGHQHRARPRHRHSALERGARTTSISPPATSQLKPYTSWYDFALHTEAPRDRSSTSSPPTARTLIIKPPRLMADKRAAAMA